MPQLQCRYLLFRYGTRNIGVMRRSHRIRRRSVPRVTTVHGTVVIKRDVIVRPQSTVEYTSIASVPQ